MTNNHLATGDDSQEAPITRMGLSLVVILAGSFLGPLLMHSSTLAIPAIAQELQLTAYIVSWFTFVQILSNAIFVLPAGKLADKFGRRRIFAVGLLVCAIACLVGGASTNGFMVLLARALQGVGMALIFASAVALLVSVPPEDQKVKVMGIYISIAYIGMVSGPLFGGLMIEHVHWRWVFYVPGVLFLLLAFIGFVLLNWERYGDRDTRLRALDVSLYVIALVMLAFGIFEASTLQGQILILLGVLAFIAFFWFQSKRRDPLLQVKLFTESRTYTILGVAHFLTYVGIFSLPFILTLYLQYIRGIDAQSTGYILLVQALSTAIVALSNGWFSKRVRPRYLIFSGTGLFVIACFILASVETNSSTSMVLFALILIGTSVGIMDAPILHTSMANVPRQLLGSASATMNGLRTMGGFVGIGIISYLMGVHLGNKSISPELYPQLMLVVEQFFNVAAVFSLLTLTLLVYGVLTKPKASR